ncbi:unnamed protein product, partial [Nesidiocoris tenuis]
MFSQWFHGDKCIDTDPQYSITYNNGEAIVIKEGAALDDEGQYSCLAVNQKGTEKTISRVVVNRKVEPGEFPSFTLELGNVMARAGQKIKLEAEIKKVSPAANISWLKDGKPIDESRDMKINLVFFL